VLIKKILISFLALIPFICLSQEQVKLEGIWEGGSRSLSSIYGFIEVTSEKVKWGKDKNNFACIANYKLVSDTTAKNYPGNFVSPGEYVDHFKIFKLELLNKQCDFNRIGNIKSHENLGFMQFSIPVEKFDDEIYINYDSTGFNDFNQTGKSSGWGIISKL
jgi:hypothetical protein